MKPPIKPLSFLALGKVLNPNHLEKVVACAFAHYKKGVTNELSKKVKNIFNQQLRIDGFKHAAIAPIERVRRQAIRQLPIDPLLSFAITDLWIEANAELEADGRRFTVESNLVVKDIFAKKGQDIEGWSVEMQEMVAKFKVQYDQYDENDVFLILSCILEQSFPELEKMDKEASCHDVKADSSKEDEKEDSGEANVVTQIEENGRNEPSNNFFRSSVLQQWFEELKVLPADAPEWLEVGEFTTALERLAEEKRAQCSQQRVKLQTAIESLNASVTDSLSYFEFVTCRSWQADVVPLHEAETAANRVAEFHSALERHAQFRAQKATTRQEDRARLDEMSRLEEQILLLHQQLNALLEPVEGKNESAATVTDNDVSCKEQPNLDSTSYEDQCINASARSAAASIREDESPSNSLDALPPASKATPVEDNEESERPPFIEAEDACADRELVDNASASSSINIDEGQANLPRSVTNGDDSNWDNLLWSLLEKNDPAAAYWLSYALNAAGHRGAISEQLLAALCGGALLPFDSNLLAQDLAEIVRTYQCTQTDSALVLLEIAAALRPALIAPNAGLQIWLHKTHLSPSLNKLTSAVIDFAASGNAFLVPTIAHTSDVLPTEAVANLTTDAARWLLNAPARRNINKAATDIWQKLTKGQGGLWRLLDWVSHNQHQHKDKILEAVRQWENRDWAIRRINELHADTVPGKKVQPITGMPLQQLVRDIRDGCKIARRWCVAITRNGNTQGDWLTTQTAKLRDLAQEALPLAENELQEAALSLQASRSLTAATNYLLHALQHIRFLFQLPSTEPEESACRLWGTVNDVDLPLTSLLAQRLWTLPELHLNDDEQPVGNPIEIALTIERVVKEKRTLETSFARLLQEQDFRFAKPLLASLTDKEQATRLEQGLNNALADARACFSAESLNVLEEVEQGVVDGIISDVQRAEYSSEIERLDSEELLDIRSAMNRLRTVSQKLALAREQRLSYLDEKWEQMKTAVAERLGADKFAQASAFVQSILERRDTRVIDECLAQIREALESGSELDESWFAAPQKRAPLEEFLHAAPEIEVWLQQHDGDLSALPRYFPGGSIGSWTIGELPRVRRQEAGVAVKAWGALCEGKSRAQDAAVRMAEVLGFLGFTSIGASADVEVDIERRSTGWLHARARASTGDLSRPIPQFGSLATDSHDLICFWDRPGTDVIGARLHEARLSGQSLLVFYFAPLGLKERIEIAKLARARALNLAVLDDVLLTFLVGEKDARLHAFLRCTLPFSGVDPYTPFKAGDVPPEMYFGREDMERSLRSPSGSCLVYGGRQLGKSALLRHAQRQFHQPERERFAIVEDIKMIGDVQSGQPTDAIWRRVREGFVRLGLMKSTANKPDEIRRTVREVMRQPPDRFVLVMLSKWTKVLSQMN